MTSSSLLLGPSVQSFRPDTARETLRPSRPQSRNDNDPGVLPCFGTGGRWDGSPVLSLCHATRTATPYERLLSLPRHMFTPFNRIAMALDVLAASMSVFVCKFHNLLGPWRAYGECHNSYQSYYNAVTRLCTCPCSIDSVRYDQPGS